MAINTGWVGGADGPPSGGGGGTGHTSLPAPINEGGTAAITAGGARTNLGAAAIGVGDFPALEDNLDLPDLLTYMEITNRTFINAPSVKGALGGTVYVGDWSADSGGIGSDADGSGALATPLATIAKAVQLIGISNPSAVTILLAGGASEAAPQIHVLPGLCNGYNWINIEGFERDAETTAQVGAAVQADEEALIVDVTGITSGGAIIDDLAGRLIEWTSGPASGQRGWIQNNDVTGDTAPGVTRLTVSQDAVAALLTPVATDAFKLIELCSELRLSEFFNVIQNSVQHNVRKLVITDVLFGGSGVYFPVNTDKIGMRDVRQEIGRTQVGRGGGAELLNCYLGNLGNPNRGMLSVQRGGDCQILRGTVIDGDLRASADANRFIEIANAAKVSMDGNSVFKGLGSKGIQMDGADCATQDAITSHHVWSFNDCDAAIVINALSTGLSGFYQLPNLHGEVASTYAVTATECACVQLGATSSLRTASGAGVTNAVSADGGATAIAEAVDTTIIIGGVPVSTGFARTSDLGTLFEAVVDAAGGGDHLLIGDAIAAGKTRIFVRNGTYLETGDVTLAADNSILIGESKGGVIIDFASGAFSLRLDPGGPAVESAGTITITMDSAAVVGVGTTFTNLSPGDYIRASDVYLEILSIADDTNLTLVETFLGNSIDATSTPSADQTYRAHSMLTAAVIENITVKDATTNGLELVKCLGVVVRDVDVSDCTVAGIRTDDSSDCSFENTEVHDVGAEGYLIVTSRFMRFSRCGAGNCASGGWDTTGSEISTIEGGCRATHTGDTGFLIGSRDTLTDYFAGQNAQWGVEVLGANNFAVENGVVEGNGFDGIFVDEPSSLGVICNNRISNPNFGIQNLGDDIEVFGNILFECFRGIRFQASASRGSVHHNTIRSSTNQGLDILGTGTRVGGNESSNNGDPDVFSDSTIIEDGWFGSTRIKLGAADLAFPLNDQDWKMEIQSDGGLVTDDGEKVTNVVSIPIFIPKGFKAVAYNIEASSAVVIEIFENQIDDSTGVSKGSGNANTEVNMTDVDSTADNYLSIVVTEANADLFGGYVTIAPIG